MIFRPRPTDSEFQAFVTRSVKILPWFARPRLAKGSGLKCAVVLGLARPEAQTTEMTVEDVRNDEHAPTGLGQTSIGEYPDHKIWTFEVLVFFVKKTRFLKLLSTALVHTACCIEWPW